MEEACGDSACRQCGKPIERKRTGRKRLYCSDKCRREWGKNHISLKKRECIFAAKNLELCIKTKGSVIMIAISMIGFGERRIQRK